MDFYYSIMLDGRRRSDVPYVFPNQLLVPDACIIYLDLNHWINLSKSVSDHPEYKTYRPIYRACLDAVDSGKAIFPLSMFTYLELLRNQRYPQKKRLRIVMEEISRFRTILPRGIITSLEFEQVLIEHNLISPVVTSKLNYINYGVSAAYGQQLTPRIVDSEENDVTREAIQSHSLGEEGFTTALAIGLLQFEKMAIEGPSNDDQEQELIQNGWNPRKVLEVFEQKAKLEAEFKEILDATASDIDNPQNWRTGRLRDAVSAREIVFEIIGTIDDVLNQYQLEKESVFDLSGTSAAIRKNRQITDSMPSVDTAITLKTSYHSDANFSWKPNDIFDIHAMSISLPYCDIVVTDKAVKSQIEKNKLDSNFGTRAIATLQELPDILSEGIDVSG